MAAEYHGFQSRCGGVHGMDECVLGADIADGANCSISMAVLAAVYGALAAWKVRPGQLRRSVNEIAVTASLSLLAGGLECF
jgi:hypothetical protein